jgi:hypothetical protein
MIWDEWLMDITNGDDLPCFVPYERDTGMMVFGMNFISDKCPGRLVGVIHANGQEAVNKWVRENPDWLERFGPEK